MTARKSAKGRKTARKAAAGGGRPAKKAARGAEGKPVPAAKPAPAERPPAPRESAAKGAVSAASVNLGHVFALRPRVFTSFRQEDFRTARHLLQDQPYASLEEAARAVVEKALELTREAGSKAARPVR